MLRAIVHAVRLIAEPLLVSAALAGAAAVHAQAGDEVPFITTPDNVTLEMLRLAGVTARDHVIDLGSGDGRIVITAARHFGASGLGVDIVADLVAKSRATAARAGVAGRTEFRVQDLFETDLARATVVTMYLLPEVNLQLRPKLLALAPGTRIVSHDWDMGDWPPDRSRSVPAPEKTIGLHKRSQVHLWVVPARVHGTWCGSAGSALEIVQRYQSVDAVWRAAAGAVQSSGSLQGRLDGVRLRLLGAAGASVDARVVGDSLVVAKATGAVGGLARQHYRRAEAPGCGR